MWVYQDILYETKPDLIIETGTYFGGSALYLAHVCDALGRGKIVTIDIAPKEKLPNHPRITYLTGSSVNAETIEKVHTYAKDAARVMVILDSDHHKDHVLSEMRAYASFVTPGCYMIVEDTNLNGHPVVPEMGPGPMEATREFLKDRSDFVIDTSREKYFLSQNPSGYLRRAVQNASGMLPV